MTINVHKIHGAPDSTTFGSIGDMCIDLDTNNLYQCVDVNVRGRDCGYITIYSGEGGNTEYVWVKAGGGSSKTLDDLIEGTPIEVSSNATTIRGSLFEDCESLTSVNFPACTSIGEAAFAGCSSLTSVNFPVCTIVDGRAFPDCFSLTSVNFPVCTSIGFESFGYCDGLISVDFPACTSIGDAAFIKCYGLTSVNFPACTSVGMEAFSDCTNLHTVDFSEPVHIGSRAFAGCTNLKSVMLRASSVCTMDANALPGYGTTSSPMVYVPSSMLSEYSKADGWSAMYDLGHIQAIESMT